MSEVNVRKRENGKWQYYFEGAKINGKRKKITKSGFKTKKEALEAGTKALNEYNNAGADITTVQFLLGHVNIATTQLYAQTSFANVQNQYFKCIDL